MKKLTLWTLHGFLGTAHDFAFLPGDTSRPIDWNSFSWNSLETLGKQTNRHIEAHESINILLGYSFGGRIALHALKNHLSLFQGAIFLSTHPGLQDPKEKEIRLQKDTRFAKDFLNLPWKELMKTWNEQLIFSGEEKVFQRDEKDTSRTNLAHVLTRGSLALQQDFRSDLSSWPIPILWLVGENDTRFCQIASSLTFCHPLSKVEMIRGGGHRFPWTQKERFLSSVNLFCNSIRELLRPLVSFSDASYINH